MNFTSTRSMVVSSKIPVPKKFLYVDVDLLILNPLDHGQHQLNSLGGRIAFSHSSSVIAW